MEKSFEDFTPQSGISRILQRSSKDELKHVGFFAFSISMLKDKIWNLGNSGHC